MRFDAPFTDPFQSYWVDNPACNNWADIGLPEVYADPDLASFNGTTTQESPTDDTHRVKQAVGVFATNEAADRAFHRVVDRTVGCSGQTTAMHLDNMATEVWSFTGGPARATDADWVKQEAGTDRRCFNTDAASGERSAAGESLSGGQRRPGGERTGRRDAEHIGAVAAAVLGYPSPTRHA